MAEELESANPGRTIEREADGDGQGVWDPGRLDQVISNLIGNALQHSPAGTPVRVVTDGGGGEARLMVENQGSPIPPERIPTLFEPFRRGSNTSDASHAGQKSVGLGLYIVDQIVRAHRGRVEVESAQGRVRFTVHLPREAVHPPPSAAP